MLKTGINSLCSISVPSQKTAAVIIRRSDTMSPRVNQLLLTFSVFIATTCLVTSAVLPSDESESLSVIGLPQDKRNLREDISKILLNDMRYRDMEETEEPIAKRQKMLVSNLAALLSGLKQRHAEPNMRMPSLRFGK